MTWISHTTAFSSVRVWIRTNAVPAFRLASLFYQLESNRRPRVWFAYHTLIYDTTTHLFPFRWPPLLTPTLLRIAISLTMSPSLGVVFAAMASFLVDQIYAAPTSNELCLKPPSAVVAPESSACNDRTMWGIVWSCATTIFLCTWVSFHPDVPDFRHTKPRIIATRVVSAVIAFLVPEMTVAKAASQWREARSHKSRFQGVLCIT